VVVSAVVLDEPEWRRWARYLPRILLASLQCSAHFVGPAVRLEKPGATQSSQEQNEKANAEGTCGYDARPGLTVLDLHCCKVVHFSILVILCVIGSLRFMDISWNNGRMRYDSPCLK